MSNNRSPKLNREMFHNWEYFKLSRKTAMEVLNTILQAQPCPPFPFLQLIECGEMSLKVDFKPNVSMLPDRSLWGRC